MEKHQRHIRIRRIAIACIYLLLIISLLALYIITKRQQQLVPAGNNSTAVTLRVAPADVLAPVNLTNSICTVSAGKHC